MTTREDARQTGPQKAGSGGGAGEGIATPSRVVVKTPGDGHHPLSDTALASRSQAMAMAAPAVASEPELSATDLASGGALDHADDGDPRAELRETGDRLVGSLLLERYLITTKIGQGGMGAVYEATHTLINKRVAVKVLLDKYAEQDQIVARLKKEAELASSIGHENIIDITDFGKTADGRTFVVMEFLEGESLADLIDREGAIPEQRAVRIAHQIASALSAAHAKGIIHRDIKPDNIFLLQRKGTDFVKVVDFGISKSLRVQSDDDSPRLTKTGMVIGTPLYMSPEQARGDDDLDHRIDVYALGVIMYELATGQVPFQGNNYLSIISQVLNDEPDPPRELRSELSPEFEAVILKALDKDPSVRYESCDALASDLYVLIEDPGRTTANKRITASRRRPKRSGLRVLLWAVGIALLVGAVTATISAIMPAKNGPSLVGNAVVAPDAAPAVAPIADAAPEAPAKANIHIVTYPKRSDIFIGNRLMTRSGQPWITERTDHMIELVARAEGYRDTPFEINPMDDDGKMVEIDLLPLVVDPKTSDKPSGRRTPQGNGTPTRLKPPGDRTKPGPDNTNSTIHDLPPNPYQRKDAGPS